MYAPAPLEPVRRFVNTRDIDAGEDRLTTPAQLATWAAEAGFAASGARFGQADVGLARRAREGLRALLLANNQQHTPDDAPTIRDLDDIAAGVPLRATFTEAGPGGLRPASARPIDAVLAELLAIVVTAWADGSWPRLKACRADTCQWAFYDKSKNRSGTWCSMNGCGNLAKQRAYTARRRTGT